MSTKKIEVYKRKEEVKERGPKQKARVKAVVLRKIPRTGDFVQGEEMPASIGIPKYFDELERSRPIPPPSPKKAVIVLGHEKSLIDRIVDIATQRYDLALFKPIKADEEEDAPRLDTETVKSSLIAQQKENCLVVGYPETIDQLEAFEEAVCPCTGCIWVDLPPEEQTEPVAEENQSKEILEIVASQVSFTSPLPELFKQNSKLLSFERGKTEDEMVGAIPDFLDQFFEPRPNQEGGEEDLPPPESS